MTLRKFVSLAATLAIVGSVGGCVSLFPKAKPVQLYRFGVDTAAAPMADGGARGYNIGRVATAFTRAATSDRILTVTGSEAAYIANARWVAPAVLLFDEAAGRAFDAAPGCARVLTRGDPTPSDAVMRMEVRSFELRYLEGEKAAPTAVVEVHATLTRTRDREVILDRAVRIEERAADNRVGAMVTALDAATAKALGEIAGDVNGQAAKAGCGTGGQAGAAPVRSTTTTTTRPR